MLPRPNYQLPIINYQLPVTNSQRGSPPHQLTHSVRRSYADRCSKRSTLLQSQRTGNWCGGSLLVVALWLVVVMAATAVALARYLSTETRLVRYHLARAQAKAWAKAGIYLAMQRLAEDDEESYDWLGDGWGTGEERWSVAVPMSRSESAPIRGTLTIHIADEERRMDLATASGPLLLRLVGDAAVATAIIDYQDADDESPDRSVEPPVVPKNTLVRVLEELWDLPALSAGAAARSVVQQQGTTYTTGTVNVNTAAAEVLAAMLDASDVDDRQLAQQLVSSRPGPDGRLGSDDDCLATSKERGAEELAACSGVDRGWLTTLFSQPGVDVRSSVFRIEVKSVIERPAVLVRLMAIVRRGSEGSLDVGGQRFQLLRWQES